MRLVLVLVMLLVSHSAVAHPLAPSGLRIVESSDGIVEMRFRTPSLGGRRADLVPVPPEACPALDPARTEERDGAVEVVTRLRCRDGLAGKEFFLRGLVDAPTDVVWQVVERDGTTSGGLLHGERDRFEAPPRARPMRTFVEYVRFGFLHLLGGPDHVLFVASLLFLLEGRRALIFAITAFTAGHSVSLALAALGIVRVPSALVEIGISATLLVMALAVVQRNRAEARGPIERWPASVSGGFGLIHGLGFAGALSSAGLPRGALPQALFGFNVGVEGAQLCVVALAGAVSWLLRASHPRLTLRCRAMVGYAAGSLSAMWLLDRTATLFL